MTALVGTAAIVAITVALAIGQWGSLGQEPWHCSSMGFENSRPRGSLRLDTT